MMLLAPPLLCLRMAAPTKGPQHHPTYTGGTRPKVPAWPSTGQSQSWPLPRLKEELDPLNHPCRWIYVEMEKTMHRYWWKELKASGRVSMGLHLIREGLWQLQSPSMGPVGRQQCIQAAPGPTWGLAGGGMPHPGLAESALQISCSTLIPPSQGISGP